MAQKFKHFTGNIVITESLDTNYYYGYDEQGNELVIHKSLVLNSFDWSIINEEKKEDLFTKFSRPLMKYLAENHHPHTKVIVESNLSELVEGVKTTGTINDYLVD